MIIQTDEIHVSTKGEGDIIDITHEVEESIRRSNLNKGLICVFVPGSTGAVTTMEYESGLKKDIPEILNRIAPKNIPYHHHETWHDDNGSSHVKASLIGPCLTVPFNNKKLVLGRWQQIVFLDSILRV